jgi:predicted RND superfamily exporter protein
MTNRIVAVWCALVVRRPGLLAMVLLALAAVSGILASRLSLNTNQLELISQDLRQVKDVKRISDMIGGAGTLIIGLRGNDEAMLKGVADDLVADLETDKTNVRAVMHKLPTEFLRKRAAMFMSTEDLTEVRRRVMLKIRDAIKRASPFFMELTKTEPVKLDLDDILAKYKSVGKKSIDDDYYISDDRKLLTITVRPMWQAQEVGQTAAFVETLRERFARYTEKNARGAKLIEDYTDEANPDPKIIEIGFSGAYKANYDDSNEIQASLGPVGVIAFFGVLLTVLVFFRRNLLMIVLIITGMLLGLVMTFGFSYLSVGRLNMITAILGGILMGMGIDFGIHFVYRMRIEIAESGGDISSAVEKTIAASGPASFASGAGMAAAFLSLMFSDFRGFSEFGLLAGVGVFLIGAVMYLWVPSMILLLERWRPGVITRFATAETGASLEHARHARVPRPGLLLGISLAVILLLCALGPRVEFEYNTRALMVENQPSVLLQDEIRRRFSTSSDPIAVYTPTIEEAKVVHDMFNPLDRKKYSSVDMVVSIHSFVPPREQQEKNAAILNEWRKDLDEIGRAAIPPELERQWDEAYSYMQAEPFSFDDIPAAYRSAFVNLPTARPENQGYLTFIYPEVDLWDGKQMLRFSDEIEELHAPNGKTYYGAGGVILFAKLARIVLNDARLTVMLTGVFLLLILLADFRSFRDTTVALIPLTLGIGGMLGVMWLLGERLNFMNIVSLPIVLGYGVSHGVYLMHRFREGVSPRVALLSVGAAVACSTLTTLAGWLALLAAGHRGLKSMGITASIGMAATLIVSFTVMMGLLQLLHDRRSRREARAEAAREELGPA